MPTAYGLFIYTTLALYWLQAINGGWQYCITKKLKLFYIYQSMFLAIDCKTIYFVFRKLVNTQKINL